MRSLHRNPPYTVDYDAQNASNPPYPTTQILSVHNTVASSHPFLQMLFLEEGAGGRRVLPMPQQSHQEQERFLLE